MIHAPTWGATCLLLASFSPKRTAQRINLGDMERIAFALTQITFPKESSQTFSDNFKESSENRVQPITSPALMDETPPTSHAPSATNNGIAFFAHSLPDKPPIYWQPLAEHSINVGHMAGEFASVFGAREMGKASGYLHDLGKYTLPFQERLRGSPLRVDHSTWGAHIALERYGAIGYVLAYGIAGHHAGLANGMGEGVRTALDERLKADLPKLLDVWKADIALPAPSALPPRGYRPYSEAGHKDNRRQSFQLAFLSRMLFSCLVDADFIDTERFYKNAEKQPDHRSAGTPPPELPVLKEQLDRYLQSLPTDGEVNLMRAHILKHVRTQADQDTRLFSLTVPTGGGKTLASLAFALDHAIRNGLRRVIFVIPFTSIVEQNAAVFRKALGSLGDAAVLEHHSAFVQQTLPRDDPEKYQAAKKLQLAMENWDAPIIVTTAVQFFESLFAARPSQCRKLHNIAGSVVIVDEAQTMPLRLLRPCVAAVDELARNYRTSVVLCTATQPALQIDQFDGGLDMRELAPNPPLLYEQLRRVRVQHVGTWSDDELAAQMRSREQVLCIVNNRRHARAVYQAMAELPGARHLSTLMCAKHRREVLDDVRQMLKQGLPCRLVSTSLIEAGVDLDLPTVLRAEAGLDSIAQAAGRCNREGKRSITASEVLVFANANEDWAPPQELKQYAQVAREVLRYFRDDPLSPNAIRDYFEKLYWHKGSDKLDEPNLMGQLSSARFDSLPLETLATQFRMIDSVQMPVIIPFDDAARKALRDLEHAEGCGKLARDLQPYLVQLPQRGFDALYKAGAIAAVAPTKWGEQFMVLANEGLYDSRYGLSWDNPSFIPISSLLWQSVS